MSVTFPGESAEYRRARQKLLEQEIALRAQTEQVAELRRRLPPGGQVPTDYQFVDIDGAAAPMSRLFRRESNTLAIYSLMYRPDAEAPCPMCVSMLDGLAAQAPHISQTIDFAVVSAARPEQLGQLARDRNWGDLTILSAQGTSYQTDYHGETGEGDQLPMMNVFRKTPDGIFHFWASESFFADIEGQPRHVDQLWPLWNMLDLTPGGRGSDWYPGLTYSGQGVSNDSARA